MQRTIRTFNNSGIEHFRAYLNNLRRDIGDEPPYELLDQPNVIAELSVDVVIENKSFATRWAFGRYLCEVLSSIPLREIERNRGLWAWLSLFFFDQVCPPGKDKVRRPGQDYRHIPDFGYRYRHRHLVYGPYSVYRRHEAASILLLSGPPHSENALYHEIASRQDLIANKGVVETALILYLDKKRGVPKQGCQDPKGGPGTIRRLVRVFQQLDVTYDIYGMSGKDIVGLLPNEFDAWREEPPSRGV